MGGHWKRSWLTGGVWDNEQWIGATQHWGVGSQVSRRDLECSDCALKGLS